jgi:CRP-like cAMP-binding protein
MQLLFRINPNTDVSNLTDSSAAAKAPKSPGDLRELHLLRELSDEHVARVFGLLEHCHARPRSSLVIDRDLAERVCFIWSGCFHITAVAPSGVSITMSSLAPGGAFGHGLAVLGYVSAGNIRLVTAAPGLILHMPAKDFIDLARSAPPLCAALMNDFAVQASTYASRFFELSALSVHDRLIAELIRIAARGVKTDGALTVRNAPTHAALGAQIGATREAVTRHLSDLAQEGVLKFQRRVIEFTDLDRLREMDRIASGRLLFTQKPAPQ